MLTFDIFCEIIDNFGDIGVVYRFANSLYNKYNKDIKIRVILDKTTELTKLNSNSRDIDRQVINGIEYITFKYLEKNKESINPYNIIVESFGYNLPDWYLKKAKSESSLLINLEYLSSEEWTLDFHLKESLLGAPKLRKFFFMPGLSEKSGGVIISNNSVSNTRLSNYSKILTDDFVKDKIIGTVFSYEHNFTDLVKTLNTLNKESVLLCLGEKTQNSFSHFYKGKNNTEYIGKFDNVHIIFLPFVEQNKYDALLPLCDFNFVRGEDSFIRAILSNKPSLWHVYLQEDMAHLDKIDGFLNIYREFFKETKYMKDVSEYSKLLIDYNTRISNSYDLKPLENFKYFFNNLDTFQEMSTLFGNHVFQNCNLIDKFYDFIELNLEKQKN